MFSLPKTIFIEVKRLILWQSAANDVIINKMKQQQQQRRRQWQECKQAYYVNIWYVNWMYLNLIVIDVLHSLHSKSAYEKASSLPRPLDSSVRITPAAQRMERQRKAEIACSEWWMKLLLEIFVCTVRTRSYVDDMGCLLDGVRFSVCYHCAPRLSPVRWQPVSVTTDNTDETTMQRWSMPPILPPAASLFNVYSLTPCV